jgi:hypothetical protein
MTTDRVGQMTDATRDRLREMLREPRRPWTLTEDAFHESCLGRWPEETSALFDKAVLERQEQMRRDGTDRPSGNVITVARDGSATVRRQLP